MTFFDKLSDLSGFKKLRRIGKPLELAALPIKSLDGLQNLEYVGEIDFFFLNELESLEGLASLRGVEGNVSIDVEKITKAQFKAFLKRVEVGGDQVSK